MSRAFLAALLSLLMCGSAVAQTEDPSGHWAGSATAPGIQVYFEADFVRATDGTVSGTINLPGEQITGLPLVVTMSGREIRFHARADQPSIGVLSDDGLSIDGGYFVNGFELPLHLTRSGPPRVEPRPSSPAVTDSLAGTWNATLDAAGTSSRLVLTLTNHPDGTATGSIVNLDQGRLTIPVSGIRQTGTRVELTLTAIKGVVEATLDGDGSRLTGSFRQGSMALPLVWRRQ